MDKTDFEAKPIPATLVTPVLPRTLMIRPMAYQQPGVGELLFAGVFGTDPDSKEAGDIWVATFVDRDEAEGFVMASKTFGQQVMGIRLGGNNGAVRVQDGGDSPAGSN